MSDETVRVLGRFEGHVCAMAKKYGCSIGDMRLMVWAELARSFSCRVGDAARVGLPIAIDLMKQDKAKQEQPTLAEMGIAMQCKAAGMSNLEIAAALGVDLARAEVIYLAAIKTYDPGICCP